MIELLQLVISCPSMFMWKFLKFAVASAPLIVTRGAPSFPFPKFHFNNQAGESLAIDITAIDYLSNLCHLDKITLR
jgi:hypothetical protein